MTPVEIRLAVVRCIIYDAIIKPKRFSNEYTILSWAYSSPECLTVSLTDENEVTVGAYDNSGFGENADITLKWSQVEKYL